METNTHSRAARLRAALWPFLLLPLFIGYLFFGDPGERDVLLIVPIGAFVLVYSILYHLFRWRNFGMRASIAVAALIPIVLYGLLVLAVNVLYL